MTALATIQQEIQQLGHDIRAEAVVAQLLQQLGTELPFVAHTDGFFARRFSRDITGAKLDDAGDAKALLHLHLSRAGLYDLLPEGIFFNEVSADRAPRNATEMAEAYKANKRQEQDIRRFFNPLEHSFFYYRCLNFAAEAQLMQGLQDEAVNQYFARFWQLPATMPKAMQQRLVLLLPYVHQMAGDCGLMAKALQAILDEPVDCELQTDWLQQTGLYQNLLGRFALGDGLTCGNDYEEEAHCFAFTINLSGQAAEGVGAGSPPQPSAQAYLEGGRLYSTLQAFYRFFVPAGASVTTTIQLATNNNGMCIGNDGEAILGIATVLR